MSDPGITRLADHSDDDDPIRLVIRIFGALLRRSAKVREADHTMYKDRDSRFKRLQQRACKVTVYIKFVGNHEDFIKLATSGVFLSFV